MKNLKSTILIFTYVMNHVENNVEKHVECYECNKIHDTFSMM